MRLGPDATTAFEQVLREGPHQLLFLTQDEAAGAWRELFPELADCLPSPYPVYGRDEDQVIARGFPILLSPSFELLRRELRDMFLSVVTRDRIEDLPPLHFDGIMQIYQDHCQRRAEYADILYAILVLSWWKSKR